MPTITKISEQRRRPNRRNVYLDGAFAFGVNLNVVARFRLREGMTLTPEEVTEMRRTVRGEVIASSMDQDVESHVRISQLIFERGKRLAEEGKDVVILMDSVTRTARAFNKWISQSGRARGVMTGGLDVKALDIPKKMFGTARRFEAR